MENALINLGLSYTIAKLLPYIAMILLGVLFAMLGLKKLRIRYLFLRVLIFILLLVMPFAAYFAIHPIYQGDFSFEENRLNLKNEYTTELENGLLVLAKPGCPYCYGCLNQLAQMQKSNPELKVHFGVVNGSVEDLKSYRSEASSTIKVDSIPSYKPFEKSVAPSFPTFLWVENGVAKYAWSNNDFGACEKDYIAESVGN